VEGSSFREADPKCFTSPRCSPHPSRVMQQRSRTQESSPDGHYQDGLVLIQLRGKGQRKLYALLHEGRKMPLSNGAVRKGPKKLPRSDTRYFWSQRRRVRVEYAPVQTVCVLRVLRLGTGSTDTHLSPREECQTASRESGEEGTIAWPQLRFPSIRITFVHNQTGINFI